MEKATGCVVRGIIVTMVERPEDKRMKPLRSKPQRLVLILIALATLAAPAWGYVVFLKDGKQIITKEKYRRQGDKVLLILQSGVTTELAASEVDFARTDKENEIELGTARVLEGGETRMMSREEERQGIDEPKRTTLSDLAERRNLALPELSTRREKTEQGETIPYTQAGFIDLERLPRRPLADEEVDAELQQYFESQGLEGFSIFQGSAGDHPLILVVANSDAAVFKALKDSAGALVQTQARFPKRLAGLEIFMKTEGNVRAGQFILSLDLANQLVAGLDPKIFFTRYVQF